MALEFEFLAPLINRLLIPNLDPLYNPMLFSSSNTRRLRRYSEADRLAQWQWALESVEEVQKCDIRGALDRINELEKHPFCEQLGKLFLALLLDLYKDNLEAGIKARANLEDCYRAFR